MNYTLKYGQVIQIDEQDLPLLDAYTWRLDYKGYVRRKTLINGKNGRTMLLHRVMMNAKDGETVDHINGDILDNRRENLRVCSISENSKNRQKSSMPTSSKFKGVSGKNGNWIARITSKRTVYHLGSFKDEHIAAHEYNKAAIVLFGEFARLNPVGDAP